MKSIKIRKLQTAISFTVAIAILTSAIAIAPSVSAVSTPTQSGDETLTPVQINNLPDGGQDFVYDIGGCENIFHVPPANFDPLTASSDELARYGIPSRPTDTNELKKWDSKW